MLLKTMKAALSQNIRAFAESPSVIPPRAGRVAQAGGRANHSTNPQAWVAGCALLLAWLVLGTGRLGAADYEPYTFAHLAGTLGGPGYSDGTGSAARFYNPYGVAVDSAGNIYVADSGNHTIRKITPGGVVTTLAGLAGSRGNDDGTGSDARFYDPYDIAVDSAGNIYVADPANSLIRKGWFAVALTISQAGGSVRLAWPTNAVGFGLEQNLALGTPNWRSVTNLPAVTGTNNEVTMPATGAAFFRLIR